jgi:transcriptional regulator with XRE-family HTH domain
LRDIDTVHSDFMNDEYKLIGLNVKRIRQEKGLSQLKLAHAIGHQSVSIISCAEICHNNYHFNIEHLTKIAYVLDVDICEFFKRPIKTS